MANIKLSELTPAQVNQSEEFLAAWLLEAAGGFPSLDVSEGTVNRDLMLRMNALFRAQDQADMDNLRRRSSYLELRAEPALAEPGDLDAILSNFGVGRVAGAKGGGRVTVIVNDLRTTPIPATTIFQSGSFLFLLPNNVVGVTTTAAVLDTAVQKPLIRRPDGTYAMTVSVAASVAGYAPVRRLARLSLTPPPSGFVEAYAEDDFDPGLASESDDQLAARFEQGVSPKVMSGRSHIESLLLDAYPDIAAISIIGAGDPEMTRDRAGVWPGSRLGKCDIWLRLPLLPRQIKITVTGSEAGADGLRRLTVPRNALPGFYTVDAVRPADADPAGSGLDILSDVRGLDKTLIGSDYLPELPNLTSAGYSRYQTAVVDFTDEDAEAGDQGYDVYLSGPDGLGTVQDWVNSREGGRRNPCGDYLVRGAVPAFCAVSLTVYYSGTAPAVTAAQIATAVAARINALPLGTGRLPVSAVHDAVHGVLGSANAWTAAPVNVALVVRAPDGTRYDRSGVGDLALPDVPDKGVTPRTTALYLRPESVSVEILPSPDDQP